MPGKRIPTSVSVRSRECVSESDGLNGQVSRHSCAKAVNFTTSCGGSAVLTGVHRLQVIKYTDATTAGDPIDATPQGAATIGDQFELAHDQWQFHLDTKATGMSIGIWLLRVTLSDGSQHSAWI